MKFLIVVTLFACVLVCANAQIPDEDFPIEEGTDEPDIIDELATEDNEDGDDGVFIKQILPDEDFPIEEGTDEPDIIDEPATEDNEDGDDETGKDDFDDDDDDDDDDDEEDGVYKYDYYSSRRGQSWGRRNRGGSYQRGGRQRRWRRHRGRGHRRGGHKSGWQKCYDSLIKCANGTTFTRDECTTKLKDCLEDYGKNRTVRNSTLGLAIRNCWKNCTLQVFNCLKNTATSVTDCVKEKDVCGTQCKSLITTFVGHRGRYGYRVRSKGKRTRSSRVG